MAGIYFHETLDPVRTPGAHTRYLAELGEIVSTTGNAEGSAGAECIAAWVPVFLNGDWPRMVTFWEMPGGWDGFADHFEQRKELFHGPLERWYGERSGGFDRVLVGSPFTPSRAQLLAADQRAAVVLQEIIDLKSGGAEDYLALLAEMKEEIDGTCRFSLLGSYETAFRHGSEVMLLWAFPDMRTLARLQAQPAEFTAFLRWQQQARRHELGHRALIMRPTDWSPLR
ncbi:hypothetical protein CI1B_37360 [Bradyrhizobium ivorense]|uniref:NIPSNAP domain-containing protein n=1 Tax=Bradyrhizobium ivorense TaxID=2511166 RepID=A0A508T7Z0_9BRAD|nr:hypothetical protein [Bradyrhizobium ivorense]VIO71552.1 hypothetical protein CI1B_37360 [Bradyrhizobium ivorense]